MEQDILTLNNIKMKKQLFLALMLTTTLSLLSVNCSGNNDDNSTQQTNPTTNQYFHPPIWIQGIWKLVPFGDPSQSMLTIKFTDSDFIKISSGGIETSMTQSIKMSQGGGTVEESITNTDYNFTIKYGTGNTDLIEFKKISDTEIQYRQAPTLNWTSLKKY